MDDATRILKKIIESDAELSELLKTYAELDSTIRSAMHASGQSGTMKATVSNTSDVMVSVDPPVPSLAWAPQK